MPLLPSLSLSVCASPSLSLSLQFIALIQAFHCFLNSFFNSRYFTVQFSLSDSLHFSSTLCESCSESRWGPAQGSNSCSNLGPKCYAACRCAHTPQSQYPGQIIQHAPSTCQGQTAARRQTSRVSVSYALSACLLVGLTQ